MSAFSFCCMAHVGIKKLLFGKDMINPIGLDVLHPQLSWQLNSNKRDVMQITYETKVGNNAVDVRKEKNPIWQSGKVSSVNRYTCPMIVKHCSRAKILFAGKGVG